MHTLHHFLRRIWPWLLMALLLLPLGPALAAGEGWVDEVRLQGRQLKLSGWTVPSRPEAFITGIIVQLDGREVYRGRMIGIDRPEVAQVRGHVGDPQWDHSGFSLSLQLPLFLPPGEHKLSARIRQGDGHEFALNIPAELQTLQVPDWPRPRPLWLLAVGLALGLMLWAWAGPWRKLAHTGISRAHGFVAATSLLGLLLVSGGVTGSSLNLLLSSPSAVEGGTAPWIGQLQPVRSDEWQLHTPFALAQAAHDPPWPMVNDNLGAEGQNMLVVGMSGTPVAHVTALAKPDSWAYFGLPLAQAMAWAWWLPILGSWGAMSWLLASLFGLGWRQAALLGFCLTWAPNSVGFSFWPAYLMMFAALGLVAVHRLLLSHSRASGLAWGALAGWSAAGYALVLYPVWQISLASLCLTLTLAWAWRDRRQWHWSWPQSLGLLLALAIVAGLLGAWWLDVREAVHAMQATIYPGQRLSEAGGDIDRWFLLKGWMNPLTLHTEQPMVSSEAASFQFLWLASLLVVARRWYQARRLEPISVALMGFALFALSYQFIGLPPALTRPILWNAVTAYRLDLALGVAQLLLLGWWLAQEARSPTPLNAATRYWTCTVVVLVGLQLIWEMSHMSLNISAAIPAGWRWLAALAVLAASALMMMGRRWSLLLLYAGWTLAAALPFHPLGPAPRHLALDPALQAAGLMDAHPDASGRRGTAVIGAHNWLTSLPMVNVPVANSVFFVPQNDLWQRLDPQGERQTLYNRFQHLLFDLQPLPSGETHRIEAPRLDAVRLWMDPQHFDFRLLGARWLIMPAERAPELALNPSVRRLPLESGPDRGHASAVFAVMP